MLSDAELYSEHNIMQCHDTRILMETVVRRMDWSRPDEDVVMDIGCGPGNSSRKVILPSLPRVKKLIAVDVLPDMIEFAKLNNAHERIEYDVADIGDRNTVEKWSQQISKVISIHCLNWLGNQKDAFSNIFHVLRPGGEAALIFVLSTPFWDSYNVHYENPKWSKYLQNINPHVPESHFKKYGAPFYRSLLEGIGFRVIVCEEEDKKYTYPDDDHCRAAMFSSALTSYIPDELKAEFKEDMFEAFLKYNSRNPDGKPVLHYKMLTLLIKKPNA